MAIEQLPFRAELDRLVLFGTEDLRQVAGGNRGEAAIGRAGTVEFRTNRIGGGRIGHIDAAIRQRLQREGQVEVRKPELRRLLTIRFCR